MAEEKTNPSEKMDQAETSKDNEKVQPAADAASEAQPATNENTQTDSPLDKAQAEITDLKAKLDDASDKYLRAQAEIQNIQTRHKKEQAAMAKYDGQQLAHDVLPALDNLERALATPVEGEQGESLKKGIEMVQKHLNEALTNNGVTEIKAEGESFDPNFHQAVQTLPAESDDQKDHVVKVLQKGYQLKDRVLRPAMVIVAQ